MTTDERVINQEQERELRWLVSANEDEDFYASIEDRCVGIALGDRYPPESAQAVVKYCEARDVSVAIMNRQNGFPQPGPTHWRILARASVIDDQTGLPCSVLRPPTVHNVECGTALRPSRPER